MLRLHLAIRKKTNTPSPQPFLNHSLSPVRKPPPLPPRRLCLRGRCTVTSTAPPWPTHPLRRVTEKIGSTQIIKETPRVHARRADHEPTPPHRHRARTAGLNPASEHTAKPRLPNPVQTASYLAVEKAPWIAWNT